MWISESTWDECSELRSKTSKMENKKGKLKINLCAVWWQRLGTCHPKRSKWRPESICVHWITLDLSRVLVFSIVCDIHHQNCGWGGDLNRGRVRTWVASQPLGHPCRGLHQPLPVGTDLDLSSQGHQNSTLMPRFQEACHSVSFYPRQRHCILNLYAAKSPYVQSVTRAWRFFLPHV